MVIKIIELIEWSVSIGTIVKYATYNRVPKVGEFQDYLLTLHNGGLTTYSLSICNNFPVKILPLFLLTQQLKVSAPRSNESLL